MYLSRSNTVDGTTFSESTPRFLARLNAELARLLSGLGSSVAWKHAVLQKNRPLCRLSKARPQFRQRLRRRIRRQVWQVLDSGGRLPFRVDQSSVPQTEQGIDGRDISANTS